MMPGRAAYRSSPQLLSLLLSLPFCHQSGCLQMQPELESPMASILHELHSLNKTLIKSRTCQALTCVTPLPFNHVLPLTSLDTLWTSWTAYCSSKAAPLPLAPAPISPQICSNLDSDVTAIWLDLGRQVGRGINYIEKSDPKKEKPINH